MGDDDPMTARAQRWHVPMRGRDPEEEHRAATPLELFFDLCIVVAVAQAGIARGLSISLATLALGSFLLIGAMWWAYFKHNAAEEGALRETNREAFIWGYGHYVVFAAAAAVGAGLQVAADLTHEEAALGPVAVSLTVASPTGVVLLAGWLVNSSGRSWEAVRPVLVTAVILPVVAFVIGPISVSLAVLVMGLIVAGVVGLSAYRASRQPLPAEAGPRSEALAH
jgi:low temperature requirement protein LtrA